MRSVPHLTQVTVSKITYTTKTGRYDNENRATLVNGALFVEACIILPEQLDYLPAAKQLRDFANQLTP